MFKKNDLLDRQANARASRDQLLEAHRVAVAAAAPGQADLLRQRAEVAAARRDRQALRDERKRAERAYLASQTDKALREAREAAAAKATADAAEAVKEAHSSMLRAIVTSHADRKAARDLRYANRKAAARHS